MARKYFGTDGIRGRVGDGPMQADFVLKLGRAAGRVLCPSGGTVAVGKDTRISGYLFEAALEAGCASAGVNVLMLGPVPTPAIAYLTQAQRASAGVVISASHNPFEDNGLKFFSSHGTKLDDALEAAIEAELERPFTTVAPDKLGRARRLDDAADFEVAFGVECHLSVSCVTNCSSRSVRPSQIARCSSSQPPMAATCFRSISQVRTRPLLLVRISPLSSSMWMCFMNEGRAMSKGAASSPTLAGPRPSRPTTARRVGSANAWNMLSRYCAIRLSIRWR